MEGKFFKVFLIWNFINSTLHSADRFVDSDFMQFNCVTMKCSVAFIYFLEVCMCVCTFLSVRMCLIFFHAKLCLRCLFTVSMPLGEGNWVEKVATKDKERNYQKYLSFLLRVLLGFYCSINEKLQKTPQNEMIHEKKI